MSENTLKSVCLTDVRVTPDPLNLKTQPPRLSEIILSEFFISRYDVLLKSNPESVNSRSKFFSCKVPL